MLSTDPADKLDTVTDELTTSLELPAAAQAISNGRRRYDALMYELRHPENHKQAVRFLCVGASGYAINLFSFALLYHAIGFDNAASFVTAFLIGSTNNFFWNRHWTFVAKEEHAFRQGARFFAVSLLVFFFATGVYALLQGTGWERVICDGLAWAIATPLSFVVQKLWSFKA